MSMLVEPGTHRQAYHKRWQQTVASPVAFARLLYHTPKAIRHSVEVSNARSRWQSTIPGLEVRVRSGQGHQLPFAQIPD